MDKGEKETSFFWVEESSEQLSVPTKLKRKVRSKKIEFDGWGSKPLIEFLQSIGKEPSKKLSQYEVTAIINDYINTRNLINPSKKKRVLCDPLLHSLFGRKSIARIKIHDLLEVHFAENHDDSEDELLYSSENEDENDTMLLRKRKASHSGKKVPRQVKQVPETPKSCFAAIIPENIKLAYLKRSLVQELLKDPNSFEAKVVGSYVRIKSDPNDYTQKNSHQLLQVTGLRKASGDVGADIFLQVPTLRKEIHIRLLSDDNFSMDECEDLSQRVKAGSAKRPTIVELEQKAQILHEDITKHWLLKEVALLQNLIDRANEKGWRRELFEYLERKQLLQRPSEQSRLLNEVPKVIAEELEQEATLQDPLEEVNKEDSSPKSIGRKVSADMSFDMEAKQILSDKNYFITDAAGFGDITPTSQIPFSSSFQGGGCSKDYINGIASIKTENGSENVTLSSQVICSPILDGEGNSSYINGTMSIKEADEYQPDNSVQPQNSPSNATSNGGGREEQPLVSTRGDSGEIAKRVPVPVVIELSDDEQEAEDPGDQYQIFDHPESTIWYYVDPQGETQGPFSMTTLKRWSNDDYFPAGFMVWKSGQQPVLLKDMLCRMFPR